MDNGNDDKPLGPGLNLNVLLSKVDVEDYNLCSFDASCNGNACCTCPSLFHDTTGRVQLIVFEWLAFMTIIRILCLPQSHCRITFFALWYFGL